MTIALTNKSTKKSVGQIVVNENPNDKTILIVDGNNKVIATNPVTTPKGVNYDSTKGTSVTTTEEYTGSYTLGAWLVGDTVKSNFQPTSHTNATATIRASDYNAKLTTINASVVNSSVTKVLLEGNANVKNVITAPNDPKLLINKGDDGDYTDLETTLKGGTSQPDVLNGSTLNGSTDYFYATPVSKAKKDTFNNYDETDWIIVEQTQNVNNLDFDNNTNIKFDDKSADAVLTLDKTTITIKDGAGKRVNLMLYNSDTKQVATSTTLGHLLPTGLKYDSKKVQIALKANATNEAADVGTEGNINLDLNAVDSDGEKVYFTTVKEVNLSKINDAIPTNDNETKIADNSVHVTVLGNSLANTFYAGGNASSTSIFYGGKGALNNPDGDKFYGSAGKDIFIYELGDGKDAISDSKSGTTTKFSSNDVLIIGSGDDNSIISTDDIYITDNGAVVAIQLGTDAKKGSFTIYKDDANTPLTIYRTKNSNTALALAASIESDDLPTTSSDFEIYNYGLNNESLISAQINGKALSITDLGDGVTLGGKGYKGTLPAVANVKLKNISSAITNVGVTYTGTDVSLYIVGNNNANSISLGAGGGTVDGGYSSDAKGKIKATADKYYGGTGADVFEFTNLTASDAAGKTYDIVGKDVLYNYDPGNDAIHVNSLDDIKAVKYNEKTVVLTFSGSTTKSKNNVLTIQGIKDSAAKIPTDTQITFIVGSGTDTTVHTYTGFDKKTTASLSDLTEVINPWTAYVKYESETANTVWSGTDNKGNLNLWHYTGSTDHWPYNNLKFTINNVSDHYYYDPESIKSGKAIDVNVNVAGIRPVGVSVEEPGGHNIIEVQTAIYGEGKNAVTKGVLDFTDFWFNSKTEVGKNGVHIKGIEPTYNASGIYDKIENVVSVGSGSDYRGEFRLANLDGDSTNGYELLKTNDYWDLTKDNKWFFNNETLKFTVNSGSEILEVHEEDSSTAYTSAFNSLHAGTPAEFWVEDGRSLTVGAGIDASMISFANRTMVGSDTEAVHLFGFTTDTTFSIAQRTSTTVNGTATTTDVAQTYFLAELDGDSSNGYELLKKNDLWKLTPDHWQYTSGNTKFTINMVAPTLAADADGAAKGIDISVHPSINNDGVVTLGNSNAGVVIDFSSVKLTNDNAQFANSLLAFDKNLKTNKNGVHIKGLSALAKDNYSSQVTVGESSYWLVNLDNDRADDNRRYLKSKTANDYYTNGLELAKVNDYWTPVYNSDATDQNWAYSDTAVQFTIASGAVTMKANSGDAAKTQPFLYGNETIRTFEVDDDGMIKNISVGENGAINVQAALTSSQTTKIGTADATLAAMLPLQNITFASNTTVGAAGIHILGYDADSTLSINKGSGNPAVTYQLVNLDTSTSNGYELMKVDDKWSLKGGRWTYNNGETDENKVAFAISSNGGVLANDDGTASGITVKDSTITFDAFATSSKILNALTFDSLTAGAQGTHIIGLAADTKITLAGNRDSLGNPIASSTKIYQLVELDGDTSDGFELMAVDSNWKLSNGAWTFSNATTTSLSSLEFSIAAHANVTAKSDGSGLPDDITYTANNTGSSLTIGKANFVATDLTITKVVGNNTTLTGAKGLHISLPTEHTATYSIQEDTQYNIDNNTYQLVNLDTVAGDYELMKVDSNWSVSGGQWSYKSTSGNTLEFSIGKAQGLKGFDDGKPIGATVSANNTTISLADSFTDLANVTLQRANYGTGTDALHIVGSKLTEGTDKFSIGTATQEYRLINLDGNSNNGYELMKVNDSWTYHPVAKTGEYDAKSWEYLGYVYDNDDNSIGALGFSIAGSYIDPTANGTPSLTSVDGVTITLPNSKTDTSKIMLTDAAIGTGSEAVRFKFTDVAASAIEGKIVSLKSGSSTNAYMLIDADGSTLNGFELTYNGWLPTTVKAVVNGRQSNNDVAPAFKYQSTKATYVLSGSAFGDIDNGAYKNLTNTNQPNYASVSINDGKLTVSRTGSDKIDTARDAFHIKTDDIATLSVNNVNFELRDVDKGSDNGYELLNQGWAKIDQDDFINYDGNFTLHTANTNADTNYDNIPDGITYNSSADSLEFSNAYDKTEGKGVTITAAEGSDWAPTLKFLATNAGDSMKYDLVYNNSDKVWTLAAVSTVESDQLAASDGWASTGYNIDDLLDYESPTSIVDGEFDEIMEVKHLASDTASNFDVSNLFDGINDRTINALANSARRKRQLE